MKMAASQQSKTFSSGVTRLSNNPTKKTGTPNMTRNLSPNRKKRRFYPKPPRGHNSSCPICHFHNPKFRKLIRSVRRADERENTRPLSSPRSPSHNPIALFANRSSFQTEATQDKAKGDQCTNWEFLSGTTTRQMQQTTKDISIESYLATGQRNKYRLLTTSSASLRA